MGVLWEFLVGTSQEAYFENVIRGEFLKVFQRLEKLSYCININQVCDMSDSEFHGLLVTDDVSQQVVNKQQVYMMSL